MSWFKTGDEAEKRAQEELERQEKAREDAQKNLVRRFYMKAQTTKNITFVDEMTKHPAGYTLPFIFFEHNLKIGNGKTAWLNWFTCVGEENGCPLCLSGNKPYLVSAYTVIDHSSWTDSKGEVHKDELRLYMAKSRVNRTIRRKAKKKGGLRGWVVEVNRTSSDSENTGNDFDFEERVELPEDLQPYDYQALFEPKTKEELKKIISGVPNQIEDDEVYADDSRIQF